MPRAGLSRARATEVALSVVDAGGTTGFERLTLAAVASEAGVAVPSLYKHVASLDDLRRLVAVASIDEMTTVLAQATIGRSGREALHSAADALRAFARIHPGRYAAAQVAADLADPRQAELAEHAARTLAVLSATLRGFALPESSMVDAIRMLRSAVHGFIVLELGGGFGLPDDLDRSFRLLVDGIVDGIERLVASAPVR